MAGKYAAPGSAECTASGGSGPQLCKDPEAFNPSAQLEYRCQKTGLATKDECPEACIAHESYDAPNEFTCECTFHVSDAELDAEHGKKECEKLLPGVSSWLHVCVMGRARAGE